MKKLFAVLAACLYVGAAAAQPNAQERKFIHEGMSEAEVMQKIGKPSYKGSAHQSGSRKQKQGKVWTYYPSPDDPQTTTIVTLANGQVEWSFRKDRAKQLGAAGEVVARVIEEVRRSRGAPA